MNLLGLNFVLAFVWAALNGDFKLFTLTSGFILGYGALWLAKPLLDPDTRYFIRFFKVIWLIIYFLYELVVSSIRVAWQVISPRQRYEPRIIEVPLDVHSDFEILCLTNLISLTPGTLSLDVSEDRETLYVHAMFAEDPEGEVEAIKTGLEKVVKEAFR
ncbi:MAG: Na+/H+ antiporter subunit E [Rhodobacteraceae bacterium]|nr:Na+/H+ antiporter subunit E [Paracoccaceae bacterium]